MLKIYRSWKFLLFYTWFIVVWGALVRASGSGDGCGKNWPSCHGVLIPSNSSLETIIEYIHRATSGLYGIFVLGIVLATLFYSKQSFIAKFEKLNKDEPNLKIKLKLFYALPLLVLFLTIFEALIGAKLVLSGLVGNNTSWARANIMIVHLLNTFLLVASIIGCIYIFNPSNKKPDLFKINKSLYSLCTLCLVVVAGLGALTALGDTLYPAESLHHGVYQDFAVGSPWILRLRVLHPLLAALTVFFITITFQENFKNHQIKTYIFLTYLTFIVGITNLLLLAPIYMQLIHLFTAQALWSAHCLIGFQLFFTKKPIYV